MFSGMPAMVRTRFATPTIGREWMIGEMGEAVTDVDPDGTVADPGGAVAGPDQPGDADRGAGEPIRVVAIDGLVLEVEPEEGGAIDYREMRDRRRGRRATPTATARRRPGAHRRRRPADADR